MRVMAVTCVALLTLSLAGGIALAQGGANTAVKVTVTGENFNLLGTLSKEDLATADPAYAKLNALRVTEAKDADGKDIPELKGVTLHYLPNKKGEELYANDKNVGKKVTVTGRLYKQEHVLAVESFSVSAATGTDFLELPVGSQSGKQVL